MAKKITGRDVILNNTDKGVEITGMGKEMLLGKAAISELGVQTVVPAYENTELQKVAPETVKKTAAARKPGTTKKATSRSNSEGEKEEEKE